MNRLVSAVLALALSAAQALAGAPPIPPSAPFSLPRGVTAGRSGTFFFDKTLNIPIFWSGSSWVDGLGRPWSASLTLPIASPTAVYSVVRLSTWAGNCMRVTRASDSATLDIGFVNNVCDKAAADAFGQGTTLSIAILYDQSGNGNNMAQATVANQPAFTPLNEWMGIRPVSSYGTAGSSYETVLKGAFTSVNRNSISVYTAMAPRYSYSYNVFFEFDADTSYSTSVTSMYTNLSALRANIALTVQSPVYPPASLNFYSMSGSGTTGAIIRANGVETDSGTAVTSGAAAALQLGGSAAGNLFPGSFDLFAMIVYSAAHTSAQMQTVEAAMSSVFMPQTVFTKNLVYGGSSLITSNYSSYGQQAPWQGGFGRGNDGSVGAYSAWIMAVGGQTLASEYSAKLSIYNSLVVNGQTNVVVVDAPSNDINGQTFTSQANAEAWATTFYSSTTVPFVAALKAGGFTGVVVPTTIARSNFTTANYKEYARLKYNALVAAGAAANGYAAADRAGNVVFSTPAATANTTYYATDGIHLSNVGYSIMEGVDMAAILQF